MKKSNLKLKILKKKMNIEKITPNKCTECESSNIYMIIYGLINHNIFKKIEERNKINRIKYNTPGGCVVNPEKWLCSDCKSKW